MTTALPFLDVEINDISKEVSIDVDINDISKEVSIFKHVMLCLVFNMTTTLPFLDVDINDISKEVSVFKHIMLCLVFNNSRGPGWLNELGSWII